MKKNPKKLVLAKETLLEMEEKAVQGGVYDHLSWSVGMQCECPAIK